MVAAAVSATVNPKQLGGGGSGGGGGGGEGIMLQHHASRPPLMPSDPDNASTPRLQKFGNVTSRCSTPTSSSNSSSASSERSPSPLVTRTSRSTTKRTTPSTVKRSQSLERRHAMTPRLNNSMDFKTGNGSNNNNRGDLSAVEKTRNLSLSSQGVSFSYLFNKARPAPSPSATIKGTPDRRKPTTPGRGTEQMEILKTERWPARLRIPNSMTSKSIDCTDERKRLNRSANGNVDRALQHSIHITAVTLVGYKCDPAACDNESVSSGSTSGAPDRCSGGGKVKPGPRGIMVSARPWQETAYRSGPGRPVPKKDAVHSKRIVQDKFAMDSPLSSPKGVLNSRGQLSPFHGPVRPAIMSPRQRNQFGDSLVNKPSILSFVGDVIKIGQNKVSDAHLLRLLHNRLLQWRFVNAKADATLSSKRSKAEKSLYNAWTTTSKLQESVRAKRTELQLLMQNLKLNYILKGQMIFLDEWDILDNDYCSYLSGATQALMASTIRLPVVCAARADVPKLKDALCSAVDVMQTITSSMSSLSSKAAKVNSLAAELRNLSTNELASLYQCKELLSAVVAVQVKECSLRTNILQLNCLPSTFDNNIVKLI